MYLHLLTFLINHGLPNSKNTTFEATLTIILQTFNKKLYDKNYLKTEIIGFFNKFARIAFFKAYDCKSLVKHFKNPYRLRKIYPFFLNNTQLISSNAENSATNFKKKKVI